MKLELNALLTMSMFAPYSSSLYPTSVCLSVSACLIVGLLVFASCDALPGKRESKLGPASLSQRNLAHGCCISLPSAPELEHLFVLFKMEYTHLLIHTSTNIAGHKVACNISRS